MLYSSFNYLPINFHFSLEILVIQEIREIQQILQLKFSLRMSWLDSRLDFYNIKLDKSVNVISLEELNKIWLPVVVFDNTAKSQRTINDAKAFTTINRMSKGTGSDSSISEDIDIYKGSENTIRTQYSAFVLGLCW